jgi:DNA helicase-2/ATP-dependent DNA helicase PcrA
MPQYTDEQLEVINHRGQHALVAAVAGSGKTTVLVGRNEALVREGFDPRTLLNLVFNKSAAESFQRRLGETMGGRATTVRTFHSLGLNMLNRLRQEGLVRPFKVDGEGTMLAKLARQALKSVWNPKQLNEMYSCADDFPTFIGQVKAGLLPADVVWNTSGYSAVTRPFIKAFEAYEAARKRAALVGFDDMIYDTALVLREHEETWALFNTFAQEVMADEAQDLNDVQLYLLQGIVGKNARLMAVGDDDQAIYGWRGARSEILTTEMPQLFKPMRQMTLSQNFRYGHATALAANAVIRNNTVRIPKMTISAPSNPPTALTVLSQRDLKPLVARFKALQADGRLDDACLLVREFNDAVRFELALAAAKIPYFVLGRPSLAAVQEVAGFVGLLSLWVGRWEIQNEVMQEQCLDGLLRTPATFLTAEQHNLWLSHVRGSQDAAEFLAGTDELINKLDRSPTNAEAVRRIVQRKEALEAVWRMPSSARPVVGIGMYTGITNLEDLVKRTAANEDRAAAILGNVRAVREAAERCSSINEMLASFGTAMTVASNVRSSEPRVLITSCHRAKGLEWPLVVLGSLKPAGPGAESEEERRLAYVAITRAQQELIVLSDAVAHTKAPCDLRVEATSFLTEAMLPDADAVGRAIHAGGPAALQVGDVGLFSAYLSRLPNCAVTVTAARGPTPAASLPQANKDAEAVSGRSPMYREPPSREAMAEAQGGRLCVCGRFTPGHALARINPRCLCGKPL